MGNVATEIRDSEGNLVRRRVQFFCEGESLTKQANKDECDINKIMARYEKTGVIAHVAKRQAYFADVSAVPDFATAIDVVEKANALFASLPATVRKEFENDPVKYVQFCSDPANLPKLREMGLAKPEEKEIISKVEVINPVPAPAG